MSEVRRGRFLVAYHGGPFRGIAPSPGVRTVLGDLCAAGERVLGHPVRFVMAGRTDAGVHAWGQVLSADLPASVDLADLAHRLNRMCGPAIAVRSAEWTSSDFDARRSATSRTYRYDVWNDAAPNPLIAATAWHVGRPLELPAMQAAAASFLGQHDFASFCRRPKIREGGYPASLVRIVHAMTWARIDGSPLLRYEVSASAFCHQQVRAMVGTLVDVGLGRIAAESMPAILAAGDRGTAGQVAPPHGLVLWDVGYDGKRWDDETITAATPTG